MGVPILKTERLIIRGFTENDLEAFYEIYSDEEVNQFLPWFPVKSMEDAKAFYRNRNIGYVLQRCLFLLEFAFRRFRKRAADF